MDHILVSYFAPGLCIFLTDGMHENNYLTGYKSSFLSFAPRRSIFNKLCWLLLQDFHSLELKWMALKISKNKVFHLSAQIEPGLTATEGHCCWRVAGWQWKLSQQGLLDGWTVVCLSRGIHEFLCINFTSGALGGGCCPAVVCCTFPSKVWWGGGWKYELSYSFEMLELPKPFTT